MPKYKIIFNVAKKITPSRNDLFRKTIENNLLLFYGERHHKAPDVSIESSVKEKRVHCQKAEVTR